MKKKQLTDEDFYKKYTPIKNHLDDNAGWDGCMFETFGDEVQHVCNTSNDPDTAKRVWTVVEGDTGKDLWIIAGYHYVNRIGYLITEQEWEDDGESYLDKW